MCVRCTAIIVVGKLSSLQTLKFRICAIYFEQVEDELWMCGTVVGTSSVFACNRSSDIMPIINTSSTGATYGKSSDPVCPLGFHPQVRWPTRCKRCFRDCKEHSDKNEKAKAAADLVPSNGDSNKNRWTSNFQYMDNSVGGFRSNFQKSRSVDIHAPDLRRPSSSCSTVDDEAMPSYRPRNRTSTITSTDCSSSSRRAGVVQNSSAFSSNSTNRFSTDLSTLLDSNADHDFFKAEVSIKNKPIDDTGVNEKIDDYKANHVTAVTEYVPKEWGVQSELRLIHNNHRMVTSNNGKATHHNVTEETSSHTMVVANGKDEAIDGNGIVEETPKSVVTPQKLSRTSNLKSCDIDEIDLMCNGDGYASTDRNQVAEKKKVKCKVKKVKNDDEPTSYPVKFGNSLQGDRKLHEKQQLEHAQIKGKKHESSVEDKTSELNAEIEKYKKRIVDQERKLQDVEKSKQELLIRIKTAESNLHASKNEMKDSASNHVGKKPILVGTTNSLKNGVSNDSTLVKKEQSEKQQQQIYMKELEGQVEYLSRRVSELERENETLRLSITNLECEFNEVRDKFRDEEDNQLGELKRKMEYMTRDYRVLQFKHKRAERSVAELLSEKQELERSFNHNTHVQSRGSSVGPKLSTPNMPLTQQSMPAHLFQNTTSGESSGQQKAMKTRTLSNVERPVSVKRDDSVDERNDLRGRLSMLEDAFRQQKRRMTELEVENDHLNLQIKSPAHQTGSTWRESELERDIEILLERNSSLEKALNVNMQQQMNTTQIGPRENSRKTSITDGVNSQNATALEQAKKKIAVLESETMTLRDSLKDAENMNSQLKDSINSKTVYNGANNFPGELETTKIELAKTSNELKTLAHKYESEMTRKSNLETSPDHNNAALKIKDLEEKWAKSKRINQQRKDKLDKLEQKMAEITSSANGSATIGIKDSQDLTDKYELLEEDFVIAKSHWTTLNDDLKQENLKLKSDVESSQNELKTLRTTYNTKSDQWIKEKLELQREIRDLAASMRSTADGEGWELERERFKHIISDRDDQLTQLKIEADVTRGRSAGIRKECEDLKMKLNDYEKMNNRTSTSSGGDVLFGSSAKKSVSELEDKIGNMTREFNRERRQLRSDMNSAKMSNDQKISQLSDEVQCVKTQCSRYRRERDSLQAILDNSRMNVNGMQSFERRPSHKEYEDMVKKVSMLQDETSHLKLEKSKNLVHEISKHSSTEIEIAKLKSHINELEEEKAVLSSKGGRLTSNQMSKVELSWQSERETLRRNISEMNRLARELKSTLEVRDEECEHLNSKLKELRITSHQSNGSRSVNRQNAYSTSEVNELREINAKMSQTNGRLRKERDKAVRERNDSNALLVDMWVYVDEINTLINKILNSMNVIKSSSSAQSNVKSQVIDMEDFIQRDMKTLNDRKTKLKEIQTECLRDHRLSTTNFCWSQSIDTTNGAESTTMADSRESLNSQSSIPLPVPVRRHHASRSTALKIHNQRGSSSNTNVMMVGASMESGYSSDNIRRLERDPSLDRMSTGSRDSHLSTQSEMPTYMISNNSSASLTLQSKKGTKSSTVTKSRTSLFGKLGKQLKRGMSIEDNRFMGLPIGVRKNGGGSNQSLHEINSEKVAKANDPFDKYFQHY